jgi:competence protein ComEC
MVRHKTSARKQQCVFFLLGFLGLIGLLAQEYFMLPDGRLHAHILDVGQGDSTLLISPSGKQILVDGGPDLSALQGIGRHLSFFDRTIDLLVLTHPDLDHIAALPEIIERYHINAILLSGIETPQPQYQRLLASVIEKQIPVIIADPQKDIVFEDGLTLDIVWPDHAFGTQPKKANDTSVVVRALYKDGSILLTGDIEAKAEEGILKSGVDIRSRILKAAHHGSKTSSSTGFLLAVDPEVAVISLGKDNQFGHPHWGVLERLKNEGIAIRRTDQEGEIGMILE